VEGSSDSIFKHRKTMKRTVTKAKQPEYRIKQAEHMRANKKALNILGQSKKEVFDIGRKYTREELEELLTERQKRFCMEYCIDWNATRAYKTIYRGTTFSAATMGSKMRRNPKIQQYVAFIQTDYEKICGVSKARLSAELVKIAFSSIAHLHNNWIKLEEWEEIKENNPGALDAIESIDTKTETIMVPINGKKVPVKVEYIKIKLYDKLAAIEKLAKMYGYNAPEKVENKQELDFSTNAVEAIRKAFNLQ